MTTPQFYQLHDSNSTAVKAAIRAELTEGLLKPQAAVSPKYLYDALGSRLFDAITELPEYYPTRTEGTIIAQHLTAIAQQTPKGAALIDLGAGSCEKAARLFEALKPAHYIPIDISVEYLRQTVHCLQREYPQMRMSGVGMDFSSEMLLPAELMAQIKGLPIVVFYPGSSIGNFAPEDARALLSRAHALCKLGGAGSGLLIGVDLVKPSEILEPAYDDALGVTASFNLNMLLNINNLLGSNFAPQDWQHVAFFDKQLSRIEMHLQAKHDVTVTWPGHTREFKRGGDIHTENSYKWTISGFADLLQSAGFSKPTSWTDAKDWFSVHWAST
ncbi:L-histidine N(alpha)-methyltransferase [Variovorax sp. PCZ-1]|uniref:L-histidine N(alpha)-methyltransferase n=1 Tax=Variovorax sp. PCZ-1 TaxID=2835533 RepID=UPI001BCF2C45|nr:L-histidine N(alpha)-methyltransferase [Variovorax sp. PCZ-1]MBS7807464.1 L-histidine N(alpha)-methyltransferase [Variovorax sp. PCZ-1]